MMNSHLQFSAAKAYQDDMLIRSARRQLIRSLKGQKRQREKPAAPAAGPAAAPARAVRTCSPADVG
jgi:hypothetical protein